MQSGGGVGTDDTSTLNSVCGCAWVCVWEENNKGADDLPVSLPQPPSPASSPHTPWTWYRISVWSEMKHGVEEGGELCVKCLLEMHCGVFSCMGNHFCQAFPRVPYLSHLVSCLGFQLCVISLCQLHKADFIFFFQSLKTELTWQGCRVFG